MVRLTGLSRVLKFIEEKRIQKMKPWDQRYKRQRSERSPNTYNVNLKKKIRKMLRFISGDKIVPMLAGILNC
jgi:hypothetical protein